jgi:hypothetical protein
MQSTSFRFEEIVQDEYLCWHLDTLINRVDFEVLLISRVEYTIDLIQRVFVRKSVFLFLSIQ